MVMAENDLVRLRPIHVAKVWGTALGQLIDLWRTSLTALMELGSGEQALPSGQFNRFSVRSADGRMPRLAARNVVGETFHQRLDSQAVVFTQKDSGPGFVVVECSINEAFRPSRGGPYYIQGDTYTGQVVNEGGRVVATLRLDAGS
jgi:hypothetical protein